jgi:hypothetical protein
MYKVIHCTQFAEYNVRKVPVKARLIIGFCLKSGEDWYCANVISISSSERDIIRMIRRCKEMNEEFQKKQNMKPN